MPNDIYAAMASRFKPNKIRVVLLAESPPANHKEQILINLSIFIISIISIIKKIAF